MRSRLQRGLWLGSLLAACFFALAATTTGADARPSKRSVYALGVAAPGDSEFAHARIGSAYASSGRLVARAPRVASVDSSAGSGSAGSSSLIGEARRWIGTNPTGQRALWCGHFMNFVLSRTGHRPHNSNNARSFATYGRRLSGPQIGAIAVMTRGAHGGHVGIVTGIDRSGDPIIISGNVEKRVEEIPYPRGRIFAYVTP